METKPPIPPFSEDSARQKVRMAEEAWNTRDPDRLVLGYDNDSFILGPQDPPHSPVDSTHLDSKNRRPHLKG